MFGTCWFVVYILFLLPKDVHDNGPAAEAGFEAYTDYIVGTPDLIFNDSEDLYNLIRNSIEQSVPLYVYSSKTNQVRLVSISVYVATNPKGKY